LLWAVYGCSPLASGSSSARLLNPPASSSGDDFTGVWQGRSFADCPFVSISNMGRCGAMQYITLTMIQDGLRISGSYRCTFGNENCRDFAEIGVISNGQIIARLLRIAVTLQDGSMCRFFGWPHNGVLVGRYQCHWGGPIEEGAFRVERSY